MKAVGQARLELSGVSTPDHLRPPRVQRMPCPTNTSARTVFFFGTELIGCFSRYRVSEPRFQAKGLAK